MARENIAGRLTSDLDVSKLKRNETLCNIAFLCDDGSYFTEYVILYAYPYNEKAVQQAKDAWLQQERLAGNIHPSVKWSVIVEDHYTLVEVLEDPEIDWSGHDVRRC